MNRLADLLASRGLSSAGPVLLDGGMGTLLQDRGLADGVAGELWNLERPDVVRSCHESYAQAGARVLTTNSFSGSRPRLQAQGLDDRLVEINRAAAEIAGSVASEYDALVAGGLGPTGELLAPLGTMEPAEAVAFFTEQLTALKEGGVDLVLVETLSDLAEADAALAAAQAVLPEAPVVITMSFDTNLHTMMGVRPADAVRHLAERGADAVGANCGRGPGEMARIAREMSEARPDGLLLVAQSNAGLPRLVGDRFAYDASPDDLAEHATELEQIGIDLIGACCGSTPQHIDAMRNVLDDATG